jgi:hypothetical protein
VNLQPGKQTSAVTELDVSGIRSAIPYPSVQILTSARDWRDDSAGRRARSSESHLLRIFLSRYWVTWRVAFRNSTAAVD